MLVFLYVLLMLFVYFSGPNGLCFRSGLISVVAEDDILVQRSRQAYSNFAVRQDCQPPIARHRLPEPQTPLRGTSSLLIHSRAGRVSSPFIIDRALRFDNVIPQVVQSLHPYGFCEVPVDGAGMSPFCCIGTGDTRKSNDRASRQICPALEVANAGRCREAILNC